jgi:hypothetical protein
MKPLVWLFPIALLAITPSAWGQTLPPLTLMQSPATEAADVPATALPQPPDDRWAFSLSIPIWLAGVDGDLVVDGQEFSADQDSADDVDEFLDSNLNGAFAMHFEARKNRFGMLVDTMYLDRSVRGTNDASGTEASLKGFIGEIGAFYAIVQPAPEKRGWGRVRVDALGGLRVSALELGLESGAFDVSASRTFYDPYIGARVEVGLAKWLSFKIRGDVGGFGIDAWNTSDLSYNVDTGLEFHLASWFDLGVGYRWLNYDLDLGSNSNLDATLSGPILELKFNF